MLAETVFSVLRLRLAPSVQSLRVSLQLFPLVRNIIGRFCHDLWREIAIFLVLSVFFPSTALPQIDRTANLALQLQPGILRQNAPPADVTDIEAVTQEVDGPIRKLRVQSSCA